MAGSEVRIIIRRMIVCHEHKVRIVRVMVVKGVRVCSVESLFLPYAHDRQSSS